MSDEYAQFTEPVQQYDAKLEKFGFDDKDRASKRLSYLTSLISASCVDNPGNRKLLTKSLSTVAAGMITKADDKPAADS